MRKSINLLMVLSLLVSQLGCATIVSEINDDIARKERIRVASNPEGATVYIDGVATGITPFYVPLEHKKDKYEVKFVKTGYQPDTRHTKRIFNWWVLGNIFIGGLPVLVDLAYSNQYRFDSAEINSILIPQQS